MEPGTLDAPRFFGRDLRRSYNAFGNPHTAAAPPTISAISRVMPAWRALL
jgi:hypothetical protein